MLTSSESTIWNGCASVTKDCKQGTQWSIVAVFQASGLQRNPLRRAGLGSAPLPLPFLHRLRLLQGEPKGLHGRQHDRPCGSSPTR